jgi:cytochrome c-type protein NapC
MATQPGPLRRAWHALATPSARWSVLAIGLIGLVVGVVLLAGGHAALASTNTQEFCLSCHEMRDTVFEEYKTTIHYTNRSGVRAGCPDCHVPKALGPKLWRKAEASREVWGTWTGRVDTPEKFEAHRMEMASREWARMQASDSATCRSCHTFEAMGTAQKPINLKRHQKAATEGKTCIECHKGIAHKLPKEYKDPNEEE